MNAEIAGRHCLEKMFADLSNVKTDRNRIHEESSRVLGEFDGDSSQLAGVEAQLQTCVELKQEESNQGFPWLVATAALLLLILAGGWFFLSWQSGQRYGNVDTILRQLKRHPNGGTGWWARRDFEPPTKRL